MPIYYFHCSKCDKTTRILLNFKPEEKFYPKCKECGGDTLRSKKSPSSQVMETLDNGIMPRRLERLANSYELYHNRKPKEK